ncbi:hypothetical protein LPA44_07000 [Halobacterium sp. KA-4]|jgi:hypothetical protein|uniref:hypothetical protein n=1 Tax=Halobacterium sp. KA-4 TaxID=2896367 RepID=UPI001E43FAF0|nr:hypothetical protein [Halobacterium sp. KA-4]MCD2199641.1 hypothetical protein [Halobacterium sp. KA-4]
MADSDASETLARVRRAKRDDNALSITGTKILLFAIQLTLVGGLLGGLEPLAYASVVLGLLGLLVAE